ncbi:pro-sigmaK processing inhibitor BofA family protein [Halococcus thailandensis]|jgi:phage-related minor tail protein|uniref:Uncharacterized protein n=1 Tax=Halococcus thailandensis JCM 13552 TaxID=1227457 RepID=M0MT97_9EURY|nr:pro-sigmaK processing inhibitor BofA family protein [Halococcus thailandensis]EMA48957.1 hypothetical protein C451_19718 [Halococcus thailandensis JCM 13552]
MPVPVELGVLILAIVGLIFLKRIIGSLRALAANAVGGIATLLIANWLGFGIHLTPLTIGIAIIAGIPGALLVVLLSIGGIAFASPEAESIGQMVANFLGDLLNWLLDLMMDSATNNSSQG